MSQPHNRLSQLQVIGEIDEEAGEFWTKNPFQMPNERENLSSFERNRTFLSLDGNSFIDVSFASGADIDQGGFSQEQGVHQTSRPLNAYNPGDGSVISTDSARI